MVDDHHVAVPVAYEAALAALRASGRLSAVDSAGKHAFSFLLRPAATVTPATVRVLIGSRYDDAGWLREKARASLSRCANSWGKLTVRASNAKPFTGCLTSFCCHWAEPPGEFARIDRGFFDVVERANLRSVQLSPDLYEEAKKGEGTLQRICNCGALSEAQMSVLRARVAKRKSKSKPKPVEADWEAGTDVVQAEEPDGPAKPEPNSTDPARPAQEREAKAEQHRQWVKLMRLRKLFPDDYEGIPEPPEPPKP